MMLQGFDVIWNGPDTEHPNIYNLSPLFTVREPPLRCCSNENTQASHIEFTNVAGTLPSMNRSHNSPLTRFYRRLHYLSPLPWLNLMEGALESIPVDRIESSGEFSTILPSQVGILADNECEL
jgi:hypothetical protein